jgi:hypothetical protein
MKDPIAHLARGGFKHLSRDDLVAMAQAGDEVARLEAAMGAPPAALLTGGRNAVAFRHYPEGDVYDFASHSQFYYHTHRAGEHGHAHLFLRPKGMPPGVVPAVAPADKDAPCHLVAVGLDADGWLEELFTTNRWVTGEAWYQSAAIKRMLPRFSVTTDGPAGLAAGWLTALTKLFAPLVGELADRRDAAVASWSLAHPTTDPLEDAALEITSRAKVTVTAWRAALANVLAQE